MTMVASTGRDLSRATRCSKHFAYTYIINFCCVPSESSLRETLGQLWGSHRDALSVPGWGGQAQTPRQVAPSTDPLALPAPPLGRGPGPLLFCGSTCGQGVFDLPRNAVLRYLVLIPNAGAPRCSWTKGKKTSCDRCGSGGRGSVRAKKKESPLETRGPSGPFP